MLDPKISHLIKIEENEKRVAQLKKEHPDDYFNLPEFRTLMESNRQANHMIENYDRMIKMGVMF